MISKFKLAPYPVLSMDHYRSNSLTASLAILLGCLATQNSAAEEKPRIAIFSGPTATIQNSKPLITSNKAREAAGLPLRLGSDGAPLAFDELFSQRLAAKATVYIEQFTAHPLEEDAAQLYADPDGYISEDGSFSPTWTSASDKPVYAVELKPEDGLYPLPFMGLQADGSAWDGTASRPGAPFSESRQTFYPDGSRILEEIERAGGRIYEKADYSFFRPAPSGGYTRGLTESKRTDTGKGDIQPETLGEEFFTYGPYGSSASRPRLAIATNIVHQALASGEYDGAVWLEGSPSVEDSIYWLSLLIDTPKPLMGNAAQRIRGAISADGDGNIVDSIDYILSKVWADEAGLDRVGSVMIQDNTIYTAREIQKGDAKPGGYISTGGYGGVVGTMGYGAKLTFIPVRKSTHRSETRLTELPHSVPAVTRTASGLSTVPLSIKDADGLLLPNAIPYVSIVKSARWMTEDDTSRNPGSQAEILARIDVLLSTSPTLAGFVSEGLSPYGSQIAPIEAALDLAALSGFPVLKVARGDAHGFMQANERNLALEGNNLTATKARMLLKACLIKFGALPPAKDPRNPTEAERGAIIEKLKLYQAVIDTH